MRDRRRKAAREILGEVCAKCGSKEDLHFDHILPETKLFNIADNWSRKWSEIEHELTKCQLLCGPHHREKSRGERSVDHGEGVTGKKNCRCELCGPLKTLYMKGYMRNRRGPVV